MSAGEGSPVTRPAEAVAGLRGDQARLYERLHQRLLDSVAFALGADRELAEDACAFAWAQLIEAQPEHGERIYAWLRKVATQEGWRLGRKRRREPFLEDTSGEWPWEELVADRRTLGLELEGRELGRLLSRLRPKEARYLALQAAGFSYREIAARCGASYTNVNKHLARGRARARALWAEAERPEEVSPMAIGSCRSEGCEEPRRVRRGTIEPLCERCYRAARERVSRALAEEEAARERAKRYRRFSLGAERKVGPGEQREPAVAGAATTGATAGHEGKRRSGPRGPRMISEELLGEVRRRHHQEDQPLAAIARELVDQTGYASARSAEVALRSQFKRRGVGELGRCDLGCVEPRRRSGGWGLGA